MAHNTGVGIVQDQDVRGALITNAHKMFVHEDFKGMLVLNQAIDTFTAPVGTTGAVNNISTGHNSFQYHILGAGQTILGPVRTAKGLELKLDATDNEGMELTLGVEFPADTVISGTQYSTRGSFKVGTDLPFYLAAELEIADVSGIDDLCIGYRLSQAYQTAVGSYTDYAGVGFNTAANPAAIKIRTRLNTGTAANTDTTDTWADAAKKTIMVLVDSDGSITGDGTKGKAYFFKDGAKFTTTAAFTFDNADIVLPFIFKLFATTSPGSCILSEWESGFYPLAAMVPVP